MIAGLLNSAAGSRLDSRSGYPRTMKLDERAEAESEWHEVVEILVGKTAHRWNRARCWCAQTQGLNRGAGSNPAPRRFPGRPACSSIGRIPKPAMSNRCVIGEVRKKGSPGCVFHCGMRRPATWTGIKLWFVGTAPGSHFRTKGPHRAQAAAAPAKQVSGGKGADGVSPSGWSGRQASLEISQSCFLRSRAVRFRRHGD